MKTLLNVVEVMKKVWSSTKRYSIISGSGDNGLTDPEKGIFIAPKLREIKSCENGSSIIIISAPGAVGKTTFAKHEAVGRRAYYWDLSKIKLGDNTFIGTIAKTFGSKNLSKFLENISNGEINIFFDAFDEAEIISGWEGVETFVQDVYENCKTAPRPNVVFFSRSETAEFLQLKLEELGGKNCYGMYEIDYFDNDGAVHFIKEYLRGKKDAMYEIHTKPFDKALKNIFSAIAHGMNGSEENLWDNPEVRSFVGYSPVLQTIGSFLYESNYEEVANYYGKQKSAIGGIEVIAEFIEQLLIREQSKIVTPLMNTVTNKPKDWDGWGDIYSPDEQVKTIVSYLSNNKRIDPNLCGASVPDWLRKEYLNSISLFLPNHPFFRSGEFSSPAFRDYCLGKLFNSTSFEEYCKRYLANGKFVLTPLFAHFYNKFNNGKCKGQHVGYLYESASAKLGVDDNILLTFIKPNSTGTSHIVEIINTEGHNSASLELECIIDKSNPLVFERRLHHATISINEEIVFGKAENSLEISDVDIRARKINIKAKDCYLNSHYGDISIKAIEYFQEDPSLTIKKIGDKSVQIHWPGGEIFPWSEYFSSSINLPEEDFEEELYALKLILVPFRKHGRVDFAKHAGFIDNIIVKGYTIRKQMLEHLIGLKIISRPSSDNNYHLDENKLNSNGINWSDLKSLHLNKNLINFLKQYREIHGDTIAK